MKGLLATSRVMSKSNKTIEPWLLQFPHGLLLQFHQKLFESLPLKVPHDLKSQKRSWQISSEKLPFGWVCLPGSKKKWRSTFITRSCTMPTLCMRGIAILALPNTVKNAIYALLVQFHSKIKETKKTSIKVLKFVLIMFWFVQLVHFSVHYAVFVITPPYARYHVMLLWGRNNGNKASENVWQYF